MADLIHTAKKPKMTIKVDNRLKNGIKWLPFSAFPVH